MSNNRILSCFGYLDNDEHGLHEGGLIEVRRGGALSDEFTIVDEFSINLFALKHHEFRFRAGTIEEKDDRYEAGEWVIDFMFNCCSDLVIRICLDKDIAEDDVAKYIKPILSIVESDFEDRESVH